MAGRSRLKAGLRNLRKTPSLGHRSNPGGPVHNDPQFMKLKSIFEAALSRIDPYGMLKDRMRVQGSRLVIEFEGARHEADLSRFTRILVLGCGGCHALDADRVGPRHAGVFGRKAGSVAGFAYSPALAQSRIVWGEDTLERWLRNPEALIPGQRMNFRVSDPAERRAIVDFLRTAR